MWVDFSEFNILQKSSKSKKKWFGKQKHNSDSDAAPAESATLPPLPPQEEVKLTNVEVQPNHEHPVVVAATAAAEPEVIAPQAVPEVVQPPRVSRFVGKSGEEAAAIKIQTAFRGYLV